MANVNTLAQFYPPSKEDVERYHRQFTDGTIKLTNLDVPKWAIANLNDKQGQLTPEHELFLATILLAFADATGESQGAKWNCHECHLEILDCGCTTMEIEPRNIKDMDDQTLYLKVKLKDRRKRYFKKNGWYQYNYHPFVAHANCILDENNTLWWRNLDPKCPCVHTNQQCAIWWFRDKGHHEMCLALNIDPSYFDRKFAVSQAALHRHKHHVEEGVAQVHYGEGVEAACEACE